MQSSDRDDATRVASGPVLMALLAAGVPALLTWNLPPSATLINQAAAFVGWAAFVLLVAMAPSAQARAWPPTLLALLAALGAIAAAATMHFTQREGPGLATIGTLAAAAVMLWAGAAARRAGHARLLMRAFWMGWLGVGMVSTAIGILQVFAPDAVDGAWIETSRLPGRAVGNLRQPNHLASLLLWSSVAAAALWQTRVVRAPAAVLMSAIILFGIVLTASRTGVVGVLLLSAWGGLDRRLHRGVRALLAALPLLYVAGWLGMSAWAERYHEAFGGQARIAGGGLSTVRWSIWSDALTLIGRHPCAGVGVGEFNLAWTLTPFPNRTSAFFDHTHNLPLQLIIELGIPLGTFVVVVLAWALWRAFAASREVQGADGTALRAAFVMLLVIALHSMLEYPLWYAYFLLPTALLLGLCLGRTPDDGSPSVPAPGARKARPLVVAALLVILGGFATVFDYLSVVPIFEPPANAAPLAERIARGQRSLLFAHHADYAAATTAAHPGEQLDAIERAAHHLLDARLMMAWARALHERGDIERARHVAARLREFHNPQAAEFFAVCERAPAPGAARPFQCDPPTVALDWRDFLRDRRDRR